MRVNNSQRFTSLLFALVACSATTFIAGCGGDATATATKIDPAALSQYQSQLVASAEPDGAVGILDLRTAIAAEPVEHEHSPDVEHVEHTDHAGQGPQPVVVVGLTPAASASESSWHSTAASFKIIDPSYVEDAPEHEHADGECKFCAENKAAAEAIVQFVGKDGEPLPVSAKELFDLQGEEIVVIQGKAELTAIGMVITGEKLHVRK